MKEKREEKKTGRLPSASRTIERASDIVWQHAEKPLDATYDLCEWFLICYLYGDRVLQYRRKGTLISSQLCFKVSDCEVVMSFHINTSLNRTWSLTVFKTTAEINLTDQTPDEVRAETVTSHFIKVPVIEKMKYGFKWKLEVFFREWWWLIRFIWITLRFLMIIEGFHS